MLRLRHGTVQNQKVVERLRVESVLELRDVQLHSFRLRYLPNRMVVPLSPCFNKVGLCLEPRQPFRTVSLWSHPTKKIVRKTYCGVARVCYIPPSVSRVRERFT